MGKQYPVVTYDPPGSDPNRPDNSRITIGDTRITGGPSIDPRHPGGTFISVEHGGGKRSEVFDGDGNGGDDDAHHREELREQKGNAIPKRLRIKETIGF